MNPFYRPLYITLKPAGPRCNMSCSYCYYLEKNNLFREDNGRNATMEMSDVLLEKFIEEYINSQMGNDVLFVWHGGEPLLRNLSFFRRAVSLQKAYANGRNICNSLQTNGMLLTPEWCRFLHEEQWLVGVSIDGTKEMHEYRRNAAGDDNYSRLVNNIQMLQCYNVEWNAMVTVHQANVGKPVELYNYLKGLGARYIQLSPVVERKEMKDGTERLLTSSECGGKMTEESVTPVQWGSFLCSIFDEWVRKDVGEVFVELFDCTLANWMHLQPGICVYSAQCGHAGVMEWNGDVYSCDHYVFPAYRLGNIYQTSLLDMMYGEKQMQFSRFKRMSLSDSCHECQFLFACHGECPKNRFALHEGDDKNLNYLCRGYYHFYEHVAPYMDIMKRLLEQGRDASDIMACVDRI